MPATDSAVRRTFRSLLPKPVRACYWQMRQAIQRRRIKRGQVHESHVCRALESLIDPGDVCLDVGANVGLLTIFMAKHVGPNGRVHSFELHPDNVESLKKNIKTCGVSQRVSVTHAAVSDGQTQEITFYAGRNRSNAEWNITGQDANGEQAVPVATMPAVALDDCFTTEDRIDVVKIDVEGAESQVLAGMQRILREQNPILLIECHTANNWVACGKLVGLGYTLEDLAGQTLDPADDYPVAHLIARPAREVGRVASLTPE